MPQAALNSSTQQKQLSRSLGSRKSREAHKEPCGPSLLPAQSLSPALDSAPPGLPMAPPPGARAPPLRAAGGREEELARRRRGCAGGGAGGRRDPTLAVTPAASSGGCAARGSGRAPPCLAPELGAGLWLDQRRGDTASAGQLRGPDFTAAPVAPEQPLSAPGKRH